MTADEEKEDSMKFGPQELLLILLILLLLFGAARLPKLARSLRDARDEFQKGTDETPGSDTGMKGAAAAQPAAATPVMKDAAPPAASDGSAAPPGSAAPAPEQS